MQYVKISGKTLKKVWTNDSMGEIFDNKKMYHAIPNESKTDLIIVPDNQPDTFRHNPY